MAPEPTSARPPEVRRRSGQSRLPSWRWEALRTTFWLVPTLLVVVASLLFLLTFEIDWAVYHKHLALPFWIVSVSATAGREVLIGIAAAIITVVGVVFSVTIVALTLASQQFGPRMMRNFVRDVGNQFTLEELNAHVDIGDVMSVIQSIVARASAMVKENPTPRPSSRK